MAMKKFAVKEVAALWEGWGQGKSLTQIGRELDRWPAVILQVIRRHGGCAPKPRCRRATALQASEREEISRGLAAGSSMNQIARGLGRATSTISREIERNGGVCAYRAQAADHRAWQRARRPQRCVLARRPRLCAWVERRLRRNGSPRQIALGLKTRFPEDARMRVSHETIYRSLFVQARNVLKAELVKHLRRSGYMRRPRAACPAAHPAIVDGISIHERPAEVEDRAVPGHWEGDLLMGGNSSQIATLVERQSRYVLLVKLHSKDTMTVTNALAKRIRRLPAELRRSLTWDRGSEMAAHREFTIATDVKVYFCDPRSPWQRGSNENTNGLLRQYFPKGKDLSGITQAELNRVAKELNERPRETLNWKTPLEALKATVAVTG
jgi:transposase, IS30 family